MKKTVLFTAVVLSLGTAATLAQAEEMGRVLSTTPVMQQVALLVVDGERTGQSYRDPSGEKHGIRHCWKAYTVRRLAKMVGCQPILVQRVLAIIEN